MMRRVLLAVLAAVAAQVILASAAAQAMQFGAFSQSSADGALPEDWKPLTFKNVKRSTQYQLVSDAGVTVLKANARASASGLIRELQLDANAYPIIRWRWKVESLVQKGNPRSKAGDDYAARVYITFLYQPDKASLSERTKYGTAKLLYGQYPPHSGISYIWDTNTPAGTMVSNPYTERLKMIVVESGAGRLGQWVSMQRNIVEDYRAAFGKAPPPISGIAVMTDTDNTGESVTAYYGDIELAAQ